MSIKSAATISINLSKIPKEEMFQAKSGDKFITLDVVMKDEKVTHTFDDGGTKETQGFVAVYKPKDRRDEDTVYVGDVKWVRELKPANDTPVIDPDKVDEIDDDLPF